MTSLHNYWIFILYIYVIHLVTPPGGVGLHTTPMHLPPFLLSQQTNAGHPIASFACIFPGHTGENDNEASFVLE